MNRVCYPRPKDPRHGFSLLECMVAILILNLTIAGMFRLINTQENEVAEVEDWMTDGKTWYLIPDPEPLARTLGKPATLAAAPAKPSKPEEGGIYEVSVLHWDKDIKQNQVAAVFQLAPKEPAEKTKKEPAKKNKKKGGKKKGGKK